MGSQWVEDNTLGSILGQFASAPGQALSNIAQAESIKTARQSRDIQAAEEQRRVVEAQRKADADALAAKTGDAAVAALPLARAAPSTFTAADIATPSVLDAPLSKMGPENPNQQFIDPRNQAAAEAQRTLSAAALRQAASAGKLNELYPLMGQGQVATSGVPSSPQERTRVQFATTGKFDQPKGENYVAIDPTTKQVVRVWSSADGGRTDSMGNDMTKVLKPEWQVAQAGSAEANPAPLNPFKDEGTRGQFLAGAANSLASGKPPTNVRDIAQALEAQFPTINRTMTDAVGNTILLKDFMEKNVPPSLRPLAEHVATTMYPGSVAPAAPAVGAQPPAALAPGTPQMSTEILSKAPSSHEQQVTAGAVARAQAARVSLESQIGIKDGAMPAQPYVPNIFAALAAERIPGIAGDYAVSQIDPKAQQYLADSKAWVEPVLRIASGAAIRPEEYADYVRMFVPNATDSPASIAAKITRMRQWESITARAGTASEALNMLQQSTQGDALSAELASKLKVRAAEAGTLNTPVTALPQPPQQTAEVRPYVPPATPAPATPVPATPAPAASVPASPAGLPAIADRVVGNKYPTPRGPMTWTGEQTGWQP